MDRFFQAVDAKVLEEVDKGLPVEGVFRKTEKMAWAVAVGRAEGGNATIGDSPYRLRQFMLQRYAGPDGDGRTPIGMSFQVVDMPVKGRMLCGGAVPSVSSGLVLAVPT